MTDEKKALCEAVQDAINAAHSAAIECIDALTRDAVAYSRALEVEMSMPTMRLIHEWRAARELRNDALAAVRDLEEAAGE
ncbi:MAG TPA: hypothetical protein PKD61_03745 [Polyangiaceae bacterium]|nr:hypothetical protein [Polyangiaceae bacterium]